VPGTVEFAVQKLREGGYFPDWLLTHRRRAEQALVTVVEIACLLKVSTRRVERLAGQRLPRCVANFRGSSGAALPDAPPGAQGLTGR
jgi:putative transposase